MVQETVILQIHKQHRNAHGNHKAVFNNGNGAHRQVEYCAKTGTLYLFLIEYTFEHAQ